MTTKQTNKSVSGNGISKASQLARNANENIVVYKAKATKVVTELFATVSQFESCQQKDGIEFLAVIDSNGDFVD